MEKQGNIKKRLTNFFKEGENVKEEEGESASCNPHHTDNISSVQQHRSGKELWGLAKRLVF